MRSFLATTIAALALSAAAKSTNSTAYTDASTQIDLQQWCDPSTNFCFGMALPDSVSRDFIGQLVVPLSESKGWGGVSLSGSMTSSLLIAAWPDSSGEKGVASLRKTTSYTNPDVYDGDAAIVEIPDGVVVNSTHLTYTFLCQGCVVGAPTTFSKNADTYIFGWALAKTSPRTPDSVDAALGYHAAGFGTFEMLLGEAKSAKYSSWAGMAKSNPTGTSSARVSSSSPASTTPTPSISPRISNSTYDYIIIGGGAAGLIAAERLSSTNTSVLLLERGGSPIASMDADNTLPWNSSLTPYDVPALGSSLSEEGLLGEYLCPDTAGMAGCVLGGSTIINALAFVHPQSVDFDDRWPVGWKWADVSDAAERLYRRNPGSMLPSADGKRYDQGMYGVLSGFLSRLGWRSVDQHRQPDEKHMVYSYPSWSVADGIRAGPVRSYLPLAQGRKNFTLRLNTKVRRLVRRGGRVTGVEVEKANGGAEIIHTRVGGKVILAAGSMSTPRILFNSGIGPAKQLRTVQSGSTGVTLPPPGEWIDLPVGHNLKDHPMFTLKVNTHGNFTTFNTSSVIPGPKAIIQRLYNERGSGVLTQGGHRLQFWTSNVGTDGRTRFYQASCSADADGVITMKLYLTHGATSSGTLGITASGSTTIETEPWLRTNADKESASRFLRGLIGDMKNSSMGFSVQDFTSVTDLMAKKTSGDHYVGTAKMGLDDGRRNGSSVVDTNAKVYGTENLYIVDASIHPDLPTGNTQAIVMIAAEAAVAKILAAQGNRGISLLSHPVHPAHPAHPAVHPTTTVAAVAGTETGSDVSSDVMAAITGAQSEEASASKKASTMVPVSAPGPADAPVPVPPSAGTSDVTATDVVSTIYMTATATTTATATSVVTHSGTVTVTAGGCVCREQS